MRLSEYFDDYYFSLTQLAQYSGVCENTLKAWQEQHILPSAAYYIKNQVQSSSFFGLCDFIEEHEYYARGITKWIDILKLNEQPSSAQAYVLFFQYFVKSVNNLVNSGLQGYSEYFDSIEEQIQNQWQLFLAGKFGVITANGFIHELAAINLIEFNYRHAEMTIEQKQKSIQTLERTLSSPPQQLNFDSHAHQLLATLIRQLNT